ncbi:hypothetical protein LI328DRAFT_170714 [Trichoderma asperelloides]|nr:hypothetical protein LI328DRAFT_170714 [Trichoderma asperelloides]
MIQLLPWIGLCLSVSALSDVSPFFFPFLVGEKSSLACSLLARIYGDARRGGCKCCPPALRTNTSAIMRASTAMHVIIGCQSNLGGQASEED